MKTIKISQGKEVIVDDEDYERINEYKWQYGKIEGTASRPSYDGYNKVLSLHREVLKELTKDYTYFEVKFINGNKLDARKENLTIVKEINKIEPLKRTCIECKIEKDLIDFKRNKGHGKYFHGRLCNKCKNKKANEKRTPEQIKADTKKRRDSGKTYESVLNRKYNMTTEDYNNMSIAQAHKCLICKLETKLVVDHCHTSGKVRGLLCRICNSTLGLLKEDVDIMLNMIQYKLKNG